MPIRAGDIGVLLTGCGLVVFLALFAWGESPGDTVVIRAAGRVVETLPLAQARQLAIEGPLGTTQIEIQPGRARIARDPSPRQLCVEQGWLSQSGQVALCLPNQVSVEIRGTAPSYDTLGY